MGDDRWEKIAFDRVPGDGTEANTEEFHRALQRQGKKETRGDSEFANKKGYRGVRCPRSGPRMPRAMRRAKKAGPSCRFMTHGDRPIRQLECGHASITRSYDLRDFYGECSSAPHTVSRRAWSSCTFHGPCASRPVESRSCCFYLLVDGPRSTETCSYSLLVPLEYSL